MSEDVVLSISTLGSMSKIPAADWDLCANPAGQPSNPFVKHSFLKACEDSQSVDGDSGWQSLHIAVHDQNERLMGVAPLYAKFHSYGEYVFDWSWAEAYQRAGGQYYPKLLCAAPFTPATGPRLLARTDTEVPASQIRAAIIQGLVQVCEKANTSSLHINFPTRDEADQADELRLIKRTGMQFHWHNRGYQSFDAFLDAFNSRKRKAVKKERREAHALGLDIRQLSGDQITEVHWDAFYRFYTNTSDRKWGSAYLTREFFSLIDPADVVLVMAFDEAGQAVAGALNLVGDDCLYGRNWGCDDAYKMLHFEMCYYQAIDYAIEHKLDRVEAGAQGHHKLQRGYLPCPTYSAHWIKDPGLDEPIRNFVEMEARQVLAEIEGLTAQESPYKNPAC